VTVKRIATVMAILRDPMVVGEAGRAIARRIVSRRSWRRALAFARS